jgi:hypothetical protein
VYLSSNDDLTVICGCGASHWNDLSKEQVEWVDAFYRNVREWMLNLYEAARLEASIIHDREMVAKLWLDKFSGSLTRIRRTESNLEALHVPIPAALSEAIEP